LTLSEVTITAESPAADLPPTELRQFGRYTLLYRFAAGGMANLYLAKLIGPDGFVKLVAVKVIHSHLTSDPQFVDMFINEARLASRISHPNVAQIIELGRYEGRHFIAMEYVHGESFAALVRRTRPAMIYCARVTADAAAGLHAAHELKGTDGESLQVVHRDVSPQNILISYDGAVKVVDFGVARMKGNVVTTRAGEIKGKFSYMAPEQLQRDVVVDRRADIFALGIVLYEITTGKRLFKGDSEGEIITNVRDCIITMPRETDSSYPRALERIVLRALERRPEDRFQDGRAMQEALERYIVESGEPVLQVQVGELMSRVFKDHIAQKEDLLRHCETTQDAVLEVDIVSESRVWPGPFSKRLMLFGGVALAIALVAAAYLGFRSSPSTVAAPPKRDAGLSRRAVVPDQGIPAPAEISIRITATPSTATINFEGKPVGNPFELRTPPEKRTVRATVSAPGHHSREIDVPLSRGGQWEILLEPKARKGRGPRRKGQKKTQPAKGKKGGIGDRDVFFNPYGDKKKK
jgi:serine/threonine-protein kinase